MNNKCNEISINNTKQKDGQFHIALAWLAALSVSVAAWTCLS